ncbi:MAG: dihydropyrimidinase, partial [Ferruginibacter sp.]
YISDVFIEGEKIKAIGIGLSATDADTVIDATGLLVFPGAIDPHVHLEMPFMGTFSSDNYETGTRAALHGGTTSVIDFILQKQGHSLYEAYNEWSGRASGNAVGDYSFHMAVTDYNDQTRLELKDLIEKEGITSFKMFMAYKGALMIDDKQMVGLLHDIKSLGGMVTVHATNGDMIDYLIAKHKAEGKLTPVYHYLSQPEVTEAEASERFASIAGEIGCPGYIVHMTCEGAVNAVRTNNRLNQRVYGETCIQYLLLDARLYDSVEEGAKWVMSPPLRQPKDQEALWAAINQGIVQVVATDHCPFTWQQKLMGKDDFSKIPNGHPAIEHRVELLYSEGVRKGKITLHKFVEVLSTNPAKIFGMHPRKGCLAPGSDADIVLFDPNEQHTLSASSHHMNTDYSGYEGWAITGKTKKVFLRGQLVINEGKCLVEKGFGQYIKRNKVKGKI